MVSGVKGDNISSSNTDIFGVFCSLPPAPVYSTESHHASQPLSLYQKGSCLCRAALVKEEKKKKNNKGKRKKQVYVVKEGRNRFLNSYLLMWCLNTCLDTAHSLI